MNLHRGVCFQSYCKLFFITYDRFLLIVILDIDLTVWNIEDRKEKKIQNITRQLIGYDTIS